jgi:hypothetical protein
LLQFLSQIQVPSYHQPDENGNDDVDIKIQVTYPHTAIKGAIIMPHMANIPVSEEGHASYSQNRRGNGGGNPQ